MQDYKNDREQNEAAEAGAYAPASVIFDIPDTANSAMEN